MKYFGMVNAVLFWDVTQLFFETIVIFCPHARHMESKIDNTPLSFANSGLNELFGSQVYQVEILGLLWALLVVRRKKLWLWRKYQLRARLCDYTRYNCLYVPILFGRHLIYFSKHDVHDSAPQSTVCDIPPLIWIEFGKSNL